ncbi:DUF3846 domain-containing protein [Deinococcus ruber]|uniref:DUF3846 domain-containing protein n=1 Tax=Deinococcus ruber TaxID=1848197 RepID=A0A918CCQ9_9DEIO|nr:hypothetical protein [Deinococcus ruber]GGR16176.1 hypothetical protein GCM10008957_31020 [Deinococcus ruber]
MILVVLHPDGRREELTCTKETKVSVMQAAVGGDIEFMSPAFHGLQNWEVILNEDGLDRLPENFWGCRAIGMDARLYQPTCGPLVLVPLPAGQTNHKRRDAKAEYFGRIDAVSLGLASATEAGLGHLIDAR